MKSGLSSTLYHPYLTRKACDSEAISSLYRLFPWLTSRHKINHKLSLIGPGHDGHKSHEEPLSVARRPGITRGRGCNGRADISSISQ